MFCTRWRFKRASEQFHLERISSRVAKKCPGMSDRADLVAIDKLIIGEKFVRKFPTLEQLQLPEIPTLNSKAE
ncbi:hypothetical protein MPTK1_1g07900 [Marchantia polymorpha subsp. ruderalis]|uniref:Uncharacterized protein n=2 Tax=Marchantia polymorpha TaxID=3197 RepID=A0AAF6AMR6_MARPO|nr:hypothetical protein MARPO_0036s0034 [Marchantia polymorpha]BBM97736.1 hypothetical protein Mp_1g07900 [Marchantia polymorpha subsp. ruderalis]|eukprot:PTQ41039.1 hypothetical protein MARPO_0036s0034 [Marchantia polymorpha]